ncbi:MAG: hypothetical protein OEY33_04660 [Bdellovibrionales bacterium]|nr:hypothetical protein [Bdellovibrionales bacterium]
MHLLLFFLLMFSSSLKAEKVFWFDYTTKRGDYLEDLIQKIHLPEIAPHIQKLKKEVKKKNPHIRLWGPMAADEKIKLIVVEKYGLSKEIKKVATVEEKSTPKDHYFDLYYQYTTFHFEEKSPNQLAIDFVFPMGVGIDYYFKKKWNYYPKVGVLYKSLSWVEGATSSVNGGIFTDLKIPSTLDYFIELKAANTFWKYFHIHYFLKKSTLFGLDYNFERTENQVRKSRFFWAGLKVSAWGNENIRLGASGSVSLLNQNYLLDRDGNEIEGSDESTKLSAFQYGFFGEYHFGHNFFIGLGTRIYSLSSSKSITINENYARLGLSF